MRPASGKRLALDLAQLLGLSALALAQPLLDLFARQPEFFVVRGAHPGEIGALVALLVLVLPLPLLALRTAVGAIGERSARAVQTVLVGVLLATLALQAVHRLAAPWWWLVPVAAAGAGAWLYARFAAVRLYASFLAPAVLVVPLLFFLQPGTRRALTAQPTTVELGEVEARAPVVVVIFDELPLAALLAEDGSIDAERFPNFAAFAAGATWFRNAFAVSDATQTAVPAMLSGRLPERGDLPFLADHPLNLFTLLGGSYEIWAEESLTRLCPPQINRIQETEQSVWHRVQATLADAGVVWLHLTLPSRLTLDLPRIDQAWGSFGASVGAEQHATVERGTPQQLHQAAMAGLEGRHGRLAALPQLISQGERRLYLFHVPLPHAPWEYLPSGERYLRTVDELPPRDSVWPANESIVAQGYGRFLLQLGYTDRWLGELVARLEEQGVLDEALVLLTADHGTSFVEGLNRRFYDRGNLAELAGVPLLLKAPGQRQGAVVDRSVSGVDLLPTIFDVLGAPPPAGLDGQSAFAAAPRSSPLPFFAIYEEQLIDLSPDLPRQVLEASRRLRRLVPEGPDGPFRAVPFPELLGTAAAGLVTADGGAPRLLLHEPPSGPRPAGELPLLVSGSIDLPRVPPDSALAVAVNGIVVATSSFMPNSAGRPRFSALLPVEAAREGPAGYEFFLLQATPAGPRLRQLAYERKAEGRLEMDPVGEPRVVLGGRSYAPDPELGGWIHSVALKEDSLRVTGWAVDRHQVGPAEQVAVFVGERFVGMAVPVGPTEGVVELLGDPRYLDSTFNARLPPVNAEELDKKGARLFALSSRGTAAELRMLHRANSLARTPLGEALRAANGRLIPVVSGPIRFSLDEVTEASDHLMVTGWAVDAEKGGAAVELVGFLDGNFLAQVDTGGERPDVARALGVAAAATSGFALQVPLDLMPAVRSGRLRVFALSTGRRVATELPLARFLAERDVE